jgi:hypothetical protein
MLKSAEVKSYCKTEPQFDDMISSLRAVARQPRAMLRETLRIMLETHGYQDLA